MFPAVEKGLQYTNKLNVVGHEIRHNHVIYIICVFNTGIRLHMLLSCREVQYCVYGVEHVPAICGVTRHDIYQTRVFYI